MNASKFINLIKSLIREEMTSPFALATVDSGYTSGLPQVQFDGEDVVSLKLRPYVASYTPAANDRVLLVHINNSWVILGKIIN